MANIRPPEKPGQTAVTGGIPVIKGSYTIMLKGLCRLSHRIPAIIADKDGGFLNTVIAVAKEAKLLNETRDYPSRLSEAAGTIQNHLAQLAKGSKSIQDMKTLFTQKFTAFNSDAQKRIMEREDLITEIKKFIKESDLQFGALFKSKVEGKASPVNIRSLFSQVKSKLEELTKKRERLEINEKDLQGKLDELQRDTGTAAARVQADVAAQMKPGVG